MSGSKRMARLITVIDTAGVRKIGKMSITISNFTALFEQNVRSRRADVVLFMIDATVPISQVDKKLAKVIEEEYKTCILVVNKWDLGKRYCFDRRLPEII